MFKIELDAVNQEIAAHRIMMECSFFESTLFNIWANVLLYQQNVVCRFFGSFCCFICVDWMFNVWPLKKWQEMMRERENIKSTITKQIGAKCRGDGIKREPFECNLLLSCSRIQAHAEYEHHTMRRNSYTPKKHSHTRMNIFSSSAELNTKSFNWKEQKKNVLTKKAATSKKTNKQTSGSQLQVQLEFASLD